MAVPYASRTLSSNSVAAPLITSSTSSSSSSNNIYQLTDYLDWKKFLGHFNERKEFVGYPLIMVMYEAGHCGYCTKMMPQVKELAATYRGKIVVGLVDIDTINAEVDDVAGTPQFFIYLLGEPKDAVKGYAPDDLNDMMKRWGDWAVTVGIARP
jgi:thiol-disulfide isomerase/thioredoxin